MTFTRSGRVAAGGVAALTAALLVAGCTTGSTTGSGGQPTESASVPAVQTSAPETTTPPSHTVTTSAAVSTSPAARSSSSAAPANTCTNLTVRVLPGGATPGQEIAVITFVNAAQAGCTISGFPSVVLLRNGKTLTTATPTAGTVAQAVQLKPGAQAESQITDHSTCNAQLSDTIEVTAPNGAASGKLTRPFELRGCRVTVDPVSLSS